MANAIEEAQQRIRNTAAAVISSTNTIIIPNTTTIPTWSSSSKDISSGNSTLATTANKGLQEALKVVSVGIEKTILHTGKHSIEEIDSQGLSLADKFYSEVCIIYYILYYILYVSNFDFISIMNDFF